MTTMPVRARNLITASKAGAKGQRLKSLDSRFRGNHEKTLPAAGLVAGKHIGGAGDGPARSADRPADDRTDGTAGRIAARGPGRLPGNRAGYRVVVAEVPHRLANAVTIGVAWHTVIFRHGRARHARRQNSGGRKNLEAHSHRYLRRTCTTAPKRRDQDVNAGASKRVPRVAEPRFHRIIRSSSLRSETGSGSSRRPARRSAGQRAQSG